ncbi:hypothetical protein Tco_0369106 [Tanacetum coccineum]
MTSQAFETPSPHSDLDSSIRLQTRRYGSKNASQAFQMSSPYYGLDSSICLHAQLPSCPVSSKIVPKSRIFPPNVFQNKAADVDNINIEATAGRYLWSSVIFSQKHQPRVILSLEYKKGAPVAFWTSLELFEIGIRAKFGALVMSVIEMCELNIKYELETDVNISTIMPPRMRTQSAGRPTAESLGGGTGVRVGRGGRGRRPKECNDTVDDLTGQRNDQCNGS